MQKKLKTSRIESLIFIQFIEK